MKWLKNKVIKWVKEDWDSPQEGCAVGISSSQNEHRPDAEPILTFRIYSAVNGQVLEFRRWDTKTDHNHSSTYLIPKNEEIGEYVSKCLNLEMLK